MTRRLVIEADGGSRGNPGPAGYGAVVCDAATGAVLAEESRSLGQTTNNVAEYSGLIAGLRAAARLAPGGEVEVRMDSKLVVEQMSGRWRVKHPGLRPLAREAAQAARGFARVSYVWVPRARNARADRLANQAMDAAAREAGSGRPGGARAGGRSRPGAAAAPGRAPDQEPPSAGGSRDGGRRAADQAADIRSTQERAGAGLAAHPRTGPGWGAPMGPPVTTILLRHGETPLSAERRFAGRGDLPLTQAGLAQAQAAARRLAARGGVDLVVTSPLARARRTAEAVAAAAGAGLAVDEAFVEADFGQWEGLTHAEAAARWPAQTRAWAGDDAVAPPGGESFADVRARVLGRLDALVAKRPGQTVVIVSHVTPMKMMLQHALLAAPESLRRMHLDVACLCEIDWYPGGVGVVRSMNDTAHLHVGEWAGSALC